MKTWKTKFEALARSAQPFAGPRKAGPLEKPVDVPRAQGNGAVDRPHLQSGRHQGARMRLVVTRRIGSGHLEPGAAAEAMKESPSNNPIADSSATGLDQARRPAAGPEAREAHPTEAHDVALQRSEAAAKQKLACRGQAVSGRGDPAYEVGYKKPPRHTRWPQEFCPNPRGRPRGSKDTATLVTEALNARVRVTENGRSRSMSKRELAIKKAVNHVVERGDITSLLKLSALEIRKSSGDGHDETRPSPTDLSAADRDILRWYLNAARGPGGTSRPDDGGNDAGGDA